MGGVQIITNPALQATQNCDDALCLAGDNCAVSALVSEDYQKVLNALIFGWIGQTCPNALVLNGSGNFRLALVWDSDSLYVLPLPYETIQALETQLSDITASTITLANAIAASGVGWQTQRIMSGTTFEAVVSLLSEIRQGLPANQLVLGGIDAGEGATAKIINELTYWGILDSQVLKGAICAGTQVYVQSMSVTLDGQPLPVTSGEIKLYGTMLSNCSLTLATDEIYTGDTIEITIGSKTFTFLAEEDSYDAKSRVQTIWGRSPMASYYEPLATKQEYRFVKQLASHIANAVVPGVDWQIDDWVVPEYDKDAYPLEVVYDLAKAAGAVVRCDDNVHVVYPYFDETPVDSLGYALSLQRQRHVREYDGVTVTFGTEAPLALEADKTTVRPDEWVTVKVYCAVGYTFTCNADVYSRTGVQIEEIIEEHILFESDEGVALSKPCVEVISANCTVEGNKAYADECQLGHVKYRTVYDEWIVTNHTEGKRLVCSVATEDSVTVTEGTGARIYELTDELTADSYIARRRAEKEMYDRLGLAVVKASLPFDEDLCAVEGICLDTPWGRGVVTANSIKWSANPLKITNEVEVMLWPA